MLQPRLLATDLPRVSRQRGCGLLTYGNALRKLAPIKTKERGLPRPPHEELYMKAKIDPDLCTVCMMCVDTVPEVFGMGDDVAEVTVPEVPAEFEDAVREVAEDCPADAIIVE